MEKYKLINFECLNIFTSFLQQFFFWIHTHLSDTMNSQVLNLPTFLITLRYTISPNMQSALKSSLWIDISKDAWSAIFNPERCNVEGVTQIEQFLFGSFICIKILSGRNTRQICFNIVHYMLYKYVGAIFICIRIFAWYLSFFLH